MSKYTVEYLKEKMQEAYKNRKLLAQNVSKFKEGYFYKKGSYGCAVGVCLSDTEANTLKQSASLDAQIKPTRYMFASYEAYEFALESQRLHDKWANNNGFIGNSYCANLANDYRNEFKAYIGLT